MGSHHVYGARGRTRNDIARESDCASDRAAQRYDISGEVNRDQVEAEFHSRWSKTGIILRGKNLKVRNCVFNSAGMYTFYAAGGFVQNCRFERHTTGTNQPYMLVHPKGLIFEDCYKQGDGFGYASSIDESRNLYEARNYIPFDYTMTASV